MKTFTATQLNGFESGFSRFGECLGQFLLAFDATRKRPIADRLLHHPSPLEVAPALTGNTLRPVQETITRNSTKPLITHANGLGASFNGTWQDDW